MREKYIGHELQMYGVEELRLVGGKGDGVRLFQVKNGLGLEFTVIADRGADISKLSFKGDNFSWISANGYVHPSFYDNKGIGWLKSFTGGFLTTCGLTAVGSPDNDVGEELPLHGMISNIPAERISWDMDDEKIWIKADVRHVQALGGKLVMTRTITCSKLKNEFTINDKIKNIDGKESPLMILYHMNMGYPLLNEQSLLYISSKDVKPRTEHAAKDIDRWAVISPPEANTEEQCYFHSFDKEGKAALFSPMINKGIMITYDAENLDYFTEWKNFGVKDYVLGLEPGNCHPDGRSIMRKEGRLKFIKSDEEKEYSIKITILESKAQYCNIIKE